MSEYFATVEWKRDDEDFLKRRYSRAHSWKFDGGLEIPASPSPHIVPLPYSVEANIDPEEAFVASLSSCHMLFFLDYAARAKLIVNSYTDNAVGIMAKNEEGKLAMTEVILRPQITFDGDAPSEDILNALHHQSHEACFIANSVKTDVRVEA